MYTAPASIPSEATVTVVATAQADVTKTASAQVHHVPVAVAVSDAAINVHGGDTHQFSATVTGATNTAVTWSLSGCSLGDCGTVDSAGMYHAPASIATAGSVHVVATAQADTTKTSTSTVSLAPPGITVAISPANSVGVQVGTIRNFTATVHNDSSNTGVTWSLDSSCASACGTLSSATSTSVTYTAPATVPNSPYVSLTATSVADTTAWTVVTITVTTSPSLLAGDYVFSFNGWKQYPSVPGRRAIVGRFHIDDTGSITDGIEDINDASGVSLSVPFTGTYTSGSDRKGTLTITTTGGTAVYDTVIDVTATKANFIGGTSDSQYPVSGSGYLEPQDTTTISQSAVAGAYALDLSAKPGDNADLAAIGRVTIGASGAFSDGVMDVQESTSSHSSLVLSGTMTAPSAGSGRGTAALTLSPQPGAFSADMGFVYYVVSHGKLLLLQTDARGDTVAGFSGEAQRQTGAYSTSSFNAPAIFRAQGMNGSTQFATVGRISPGGDGTLAGIRDQNFASTVTLNSSFTGSYAVDSSGRSTLTLGSVNAVAYLFGPNQGYLLLLDTGAGVLSGSFKPQSAGPFGTSSLAATYRHGEPSVLSKWCESDAGTTTFNGTGALTGYQDYSYFIYESDWFLGYSRYSLVFSSQSLSGTYTIESNGRGVISLVGYDGLPLVFWMVSPDEIITLDTAGVSDSLPGLLQYLK